MSEATPEAPSAQGEPSNEEPTEGTPGEPEDTDWQAEATRLREELSKARKWEKQSRDNAAKLREYEREKLPEAERAAAEAEERGRTAATAEFGKELARTQFDALAGRRNAEFDTAKALKRLDLSSLLGEDGRPDLKEIQAAVDDLVPAPADGPTSFDGGARTTAPAQQGMSGLIRKAAGRA